MVSPKSKNSTCKGQAAARALHVRRRGLLTQAEKIPKPLPHPYTRALHARRGLLTQAEKISKPLTHPYTGRLTPGALPT